jgi:anti-sigma B factor antagonist
VPDATPCTQRDIGDVTILELRGQLKEDGDIPLPEIVADLVRRGRQKLVLDLGAVTRIDSTGVGLVTAKYLTVRRLGGDLKLLHLTPRARQLLSITKLERVFEIFDDEDEAVRSFAQAAARTFFGSDRRISSTPRGGLRRRAADRRT